MSEMNGQGIVENRDRDNNIGDKRGVIKRALRRGAIVAPDSVDSCLIDG